MLPLLAVAVVVLVGLVIVVLVCRKKGSPQPVTPPAEPSEGECRMARSEILQKLANKEISREEAEQKLVAFGDPVSPVMPPSPQPQNSKGCGCLAGVLIAIGLVLAMLLMLIASVFITRVGVRTTHDHGGGSEKITHRMQIHAGTPPLQPITEDEALAEEDSP